MAGEGAKEQEAQVGPDKVWEALAQSSASDGSVREPAEKMLQKWENEITPGFMASLVTICGNEGANESLRLMAAILMKNTVGSSWRKVLGTREWPRAPEWEKSFVRDESLRLAVEEKNGQISLQLALLIANIARFDFPTNWPDLLEALQRTVQWESNSGLDAKSRSLHCLKHVVRALGGKAVVATAATPEAVAKANNEAREPQDHCAKLFGPLANEWSGHINAALSGQDTDSADQRAQLACRCLQVLRSLISIIPSLDSTGIQIGSFFESVLQQMQNSYQSMWPTLQKHARLLCECVLSALEKHPISFAPFLSPFVTIFTQQILALPQDALATDHKRALVLTRFLYRTLTNSLYSPPTGQQAEAQAASSEYSQQERQRAAEYAAAAFEPLFADNSVVSTLVTRYFTLTNPEIEEWQAESEGQFQRRVTHRGSADADSPRPCAELLLTAMLSREPEKVSNVVLHLAAHAQSKPLNDPNNALHRDACYRAVGLVGESLSNEIIDFNAWFQNELEPMLTVEGDEASLLQARILRARALWLIGCFQSRLNRQVRRRALELLLKHIDPSDPLVALHAVEALDCLFTPAVLTDVSSPPPTIEPSLAKDVHDHEGQQLLIEAGPEALRRLFSLAVQLGTSEGLLQVLGVMSCFFAVMGRGYLSPYLGEIAQELPRVWQAVANASQQTGAEARMHSLLMALFTQLVDLLGTDALHHPGICGVLYPLLDNATDPSSPAYLYLVDDGLKLWLAALRGCAQIDEHLMARFPRLISVLSKEHSRVGLLLLQGYLLVGGREFVEGNAQQIASAVEGAVDRLQEGPAEEILASGVVADLLIQIAEHTGIAALESALRKAIQHVAGTNREKKLPLDPLKLRGVVNILARVAIVKPDNISFLCDSDFSTEDRVLELWTSILSIPTAQSLMTQANSVADKDRHASALALCMLLGSRDECAWQRLPGVLRLILRVLLEFKELGLAQEDGKCILPPEPRRMQNDQEPNQVDIQSENLSKVDPVHTYDLRECARAVLQSASEGRGGHSALWQTAESFSETLRDVLSDLLQ